MKRWLILMGAIALLSLAYLSIHPASSKANPVWQRVKQAAPPQLEQQLRQDYAPYKRTDTPVDIGQMQMLKLEQPGSLPLYLINTRVYPKGHSELTLTCGIGGCLTLGYIPQGERFKQVLNRWMNDFQVEGAPPVIQPIKRVLNRVPCFQLSGYSPSTGQPNQTQTLCFDGNEFVQAGDEPPNPSNSDQSNYGHSN